MTLRRTIGRALHSMTNASAPRGWDEPATITTAQAAQALGIRHTPGLGETPNMAALAAQHGDRSEVAVLRESLATAKAELAARDRAGLGESLAGQVGYRAERDMLRAQLAETRRQRDDAVAALDAETRLWTAAERSLARVTRDLALRTTQRDKARSDRDRAVADRYTLQTQLDDTVRALALIVQAAGGKVSVAKADLLQDALTVQWSEDMLADALVFSTSPKSAPC